MRSYELRYEYKRSSFEAQKHPSLAPLTELIGFTFDYREEYQAYVGNIGYPLDRTTRYTSQPEIDITLRLDFAHPSCFEWHGYELCQQEALTVLAILCTEIPPLPWEYEP